MKISWRNSINKREDGYRDAYLGQDINQAKLGIMLLIVPIVLFAVNDFEFLHFSQMFYFLISVRLALLIFSVLVIAYFKRIQNYHSYDTAIFSWGVATVVLTATINGLRAENFLFTVIIVVIMIFSIWLVIPTNVPAKIILSTIVTADEMAILILNIQTIAATQLFSIFLGLILSNAIGISVCWQMNSYRKDMFETQHRVRANEAKLRGITDSAKDGIIMINKHGEIGFWSPATERISGYTSGEVLGKSMLDLIIPERFRDSVGKGLAILVKSVKIPVFGKELDISLLRKDGTEVPVELSLSTLQIEHELYAVGILRDVTERKIAERAVAESEEKYKKQFEAVSDAIFLVDVENGIIVDCNKAATELIEKPQKELLGQHLRVLHPVSFNFDLSFKLQLKNPNNVVESQVITKDGELKDVSIRACLLELHGKKLMESVFRDITEAKLRQRLLDESQQEFMALFKGNPEPTVFVDNNMNVIDINQSFKELFGYTLEETKGKNLKGFVVPNDQEKSYEEIAKNLQEGPVQKYLVRKKKDGSEINVSFSGAPITVNGKILGLIGVYKDMSEIVLAQEELNKSLEYTLDTQKELATSLKHSEILNEKLNVVGGFARHDVRNKLAVIDGNLFLARKQVKENPKLSYILNQIEGASRNIVRILEFAKTYEMIGCQEQIPVNVGKAVEEAASLFSDLKGVKIINECSKLVVTADSVLTTVFYNLIDNALKYGQKITQIRIYAQRNNDGTCLLIVEDNGEGIDTDLKKNLFNKGYGKGTGYGLYLIRKIIEIYGWKVEEISEPGKGAKFAFKMPAELVKGIEPVAVEVLSGHNGEKCSGSTTTL